MGDTMNKEQRELFRFYLDSKKKERDNMKKTFDDWLVEKALSAICRKNTCDECLLNGDNPNSIGDCGQLSIVQVRALLYLIYKAETE